MSFHFRGPNCATKVRTSSSSDASQLREREFEQPAVACPSSNSRPNSSILVAGMLSEGATSWLTSLADFCTDIPGLYGQSRAQQLVIDVKSLRVATGIDGLPTGNREHTGRPARQTPASSRFNLARFVIEKSDGHIYEQRASIVMGMPERLH